MRHFAHFTDCTNRQLRQFGASFVIVLPLLAWWWLKGTAIVIVGAVMAGTVVAVVGYFVPRSLRPVFIVLSLLAWPLGVVVQEICLILLFLVAFVPLGLIFRWLGRDALQRKFDTDAATYWQPRPPAPAPGRYYRRW